MFFNNLDYLKSDADLSCIRKSYRSSDDICQYYIELSDELNTKMQFIFNKFEDSNLTRIEIVDLTIKQGIAKCSHYADQHLEFSTFLHHELLKDYEHAKSQLLNFEKKGG